MIHKIRIILESEKDVFRDLEIGVNQTLEELHQGIKDAFELEGDEMASFYLSNDQWFQGSEIPLENLSEEEEEIETMRQIAVNQVIPDKGNKMIYVYDFFRLWTFYVEVVETEVITVNGELPAVVFSYGQRPSEPPENDMFGDFDDDFTDLDEDDLDDFDDGFNEEDYF